jgi:hypothetical protein
LTTGSQFGERLDPERRERVEYAIKFPADGEQVLLPIDSKFAQENYDHLQEVVSASIASSFYDHYSERLLMRQASDTLARHTRRVAFGVGCEVRVSDARAAQTGGYHGQAGRLAHDQAVVMKNILGLKWVLNKR